MKYILSAILCGASMLAQAQDTYLNDRLTATDDVQGSARYVAMGGALGALGADLSVMGSNPGAMGLYRRTDIGMTFGVISPNGNGWDPKLPGAYNEKLSRGSFDQFGLVWSIPLGGKLQRINVGLNYHKKKNFNQGFFADNDALNGLTQMDQVAELATSYNDRIDDDKMVDNLACLAAVPVYDDNAHDGDYLTHPTTSDGSYDVHPNYNTNPSVRNNYTTHQRGGLHALDMNIAFNINDRFYTGITFGVDNINYTSWSQYEEYNADDVMNHMLYNDRSIKGSGINTKVGFVVRPLEESPFRIGLAVETPTKYRLRSSTLFNLAYEEPSDGKVYKSDQLESYLEYTIRTPWKVRASLGTTVGTKLALGAEYEIANYARTKMGYPRYYDDYDGYTYASYSDYAMNDHTKQMLKAQHTVKLGAEFMAHKYIALRAGYNFVSTRYKDDISFDQYAIHDAAGDDVSAIDNATSTDYMSLGYANIVTTGIGFKYKKFYADITYKCRLQHGDFYAFDTTGVGAQQLQPVDVNLSTHQLMFGLGVKF